MAIPPAPAAPLVTPEHGVIPAATIGVPDLGDPAFGLNTDRLLQVIGKPFALATMRALPIQPRALETVRRILAAGRQLGIEHGTPEFTLQQVATIANIRPGAVYRYFSTPDDLIRMLIRLWTVGQHDRFRARLKALHFHSVEALADEIAASVSRLLDNDFYEPGLSRRVKLKLYRDYHDIPLAELTTMAGDIAAVMARDGLGGDSETRARLAMAFAGASAFTKMTLLHAPEMRSSAYFRDTIRGLFLGALRATVALPSADPAGAPGGD